MHVSHICSTLISAAGKVVVLHLQVAMQRTILLASVCYLQAQPGLQHQTPWPQQYKALLVGVRGENICTEAGRTCAKKMAQDLQGHQKHPPLHVDISNNGPAVMTISIVNTAAFKLVMWI